MRTKLLWGDNFCQYEGHDKIERTGGPKSGLQGVSYIQCQSQQESHIDFIMHQCFLCDFLGQIMRTFDDLSRVLIVDLLFQLNCKCQKWLKMTKKGPKWIKKRPKWTKMGQNETKRPSMVMFYDFGPFLTILGLLGQFLTISDRFGSFGADFENFQHFSHNCSGTDIS